METQAASHRESYFMRASTLIGVFLSLIVSLFIVTVMAEAKWYRLALDTVSHATPIFNENSASPSLIVPGKGNITPSPAARLPHSVPDSGPAPDSDSGSGTLVLGDMTIGQRLHNLGKLVLLPDAPPTPIRITIAVGTSQILVPLDQAKLQAELRWYAITRVITVFIVLMLLSFVVTAFDFYFMVKPSQDLVAAINQFSQDPTTARPIPESLYARKDFTAAGQALEELQQNTLLALRQRERLADIGEAVAKISHDIRNALSSATLLTEALLTSPDKRVQRSAPYVVQSLEQAVDMCQSMLDYLTEQPKANPERIRISKLAHDLSANSPIEVETSGADVIFADLQLMTRILLNLVRNAASAGATKVTIDVWKVRHLAVIDIADDGPGIVADLWPELFMAFKGYQAGGSGLGLAIARDLAVAQGGNLKLSRSTADGSEFRLQLPVRLLERATG